jgi:hypothetical protein
MNNTKYLIATTQPFEELANDMIESAELQESQIVAIRNYDYTGKHDFGTAGFNSTVNNRAQYLHEYLTAGFDCWILDADLIFLDPLDQIAIPEDADIFAQHDPDSGICMGFVYFRSTLHTIRFAELLALNTRHDKCNDQIIANAVYSKMKDPPKLVYCETAMSFGLIAGELWNGQEFNLPKETQVFHANYTVGLENKTKLLEYVKCKSR